ncbi:hydroxypyruvate reductase [Subtercola lobariae]|uniref:Hydroxypyruvate reductase n=2 Tax=Subtercola lobariae TaxID=1588641 RepID=A0A917B025_9MICO|nr:hydroxypyruvate reductase [Subtercola lobariae]
MIYEKIGPGTHLVEELATHGIDADQPFGPESTLLRHAPISEDRMIELAAGYDGLIGISGSKLTRRVFEALPQLKYVSKIGIGYDVIDIDAANDLGVKVTNTPSPIEIISVAEHAVTLILAAAKRLDYYSLDRIRSGGWTDSVIRSRNLYGSTLGLVGYGRIARAVASRLAPWGVNIVAYDVASIEDSEGVRMVSLDELLSVSDVVSLHAPSFAGGKPVLDAGAIGRLKRGAIVVNTARGVLVDQDALSQALASGQVSVAALDVFEPEPPPGDLELFTNSNLLTTPHCAANVVEAEADMERMAVTNMVELLAGGEPTSLITARTVAP